MKTGKKFATNFFKLWKKIIIKIIKKTSSSSLFLLDLIIELYQGYFKHWSIQWLGFLPNHLMSPSMWVGLMLSCSRPVSWQALYGSGDPGGLVRGRERESVFPGIGGSFPGGGWNRRRSHEVRVLPKNLRSSGFFPPLPPPRPINFTRVPDMTTRLSSSSCLNSVIQTRSSWINIFLIFWIWFAIHVCETFGDWSPSEYKKKLGASNLSNKIKRELQSCENRRKSQFLDWSSLVFRSGSEHTTWNPLFVEFLAVRM